MEKHAEYLKAKKLAHPGISYEWSDYGFTINLANLADRKIANIFIIHKGRAGERQIDDAIDYLLGKTSEWFEVAPLAAAEDSDELIYEYRRRSGGRSAVMTGKSREISGTDKQGLRDFMTEVAAGGSMKD